MLCLFLLLPAFLHAQTLDGYRVDFQGADALKDLLNQHLQIARQTENKETTLPELQRLVDITPEQIRQLLATEGYFSPTIERSLEQVNGDWVARFYLTLGPRVYVNDVQIRFKGHIAEVPNNERRIKQLRRSWELEPGEPFRQEAWDAAKNELIAPLLIEDYPTATVVSSEAAIDPEKRTAALNVVVDSGPAFTFGELRIEGLQRYSREIIDALNAINPGEVFSQEKLNELQARIQDTGYFRSAFATVEADPANPKLVPVVVTVNELERKRLSVGVGFSTDTGPRLELRWLDRNFLERNWRLESNVLVDRNTRAIGSELFFLPLEIGWVPSVGVNYERNEITGEITNKLRAAGRLHRLLTRSEQTWSLSYYSDEQRIPGELLNHRQALLLSYAYKRRRVDNALAPRRGHISSIEVGGGIGGLLNEENIVRVVGRTNWFIPLGTRWSGVLRGQIGHIAGADRESIPSDLLFRTGGDQSVRGYAYNTIGVPQAGAIVGGTVLGVASAELVYHITPQWGAAVFTDAGDAADSWSSFDVQRATGVGARWRSPVGPVNLDVARAHEPGDWRIHFSIGYGF